MTFDDYRIESIKRVARKNHAKIWTNVVQRLEQKHEINVGKLSKVTKTGDVIAVPGKVLGAGVIQHSITIGAVSFSESAKEKIKSAGGTIMLIEKLVETNPNGKGVKIFVG